jgi:hypothetical protein
MMAAAMAPATPIRATMICTVRSPPVVITAKAKITPERPRRITYLSHCDGSNSQPWLSETMKVNHSSEGRGLRGCCCLDRAPSEGGVRELVAAGVHFEGASFVAGRDQLVQVGGEKIREGASALELRDMTTFVRQEAAR